MRRFDPDNIIVQYGRLYSSIKEGEVFIYWAYFDVFCGLCRGLCGGGGVDNHLQLDNQVEKHSVWHVTTSMR